MAFLHSVMGDNTPENREHLEKVGYKFINLSWDGKYIFTSKDKNEAYYANGSGFGHINCIGNPQLFKAVSAMSDDSYIHQWHIIDYDVYIDMPKDYWFIATDLSGGKHVGCQIDPMYCHKATLSELQAHFQRV